MRTENKYKNVYFTQCNDVGENEGGYFIQFYSDSDFSNEIDYMVLHKGTDEVNNPKKYIQEYIVNENLEYAVARDLIKRGIQDNSKMIEIVDIFMNENDKIGLEELYKVTEDKLVKILLNWKDEYEGFVDDYNTYVGSMYNDIMDYVWEKYKLNEIGKYINNSEEIKDFETNIHEDEEEM